MTSATPAAGHSSQNAGITYASAGVDVEAGDRAVELMKDAVKATHNSSVIGGVGGFAGLYDVPVFSRVANSESKHLEAVRNLMERYGVTDPTVDHATGVFSDESLQKLYDELLVQGQASQEGAFEAGRTVEKTDIEGLTAAAEGATTAPDAKAVFTRLLEASKHHLAAFGG